MYINILICILLKYIYIYIWQVINNISCHFFCATLVVTETGKEGLSQHEDKTKEETLPTKCYVTQHHSSSNNASFGQGKNNHNETTRDTKQDSNFEGSKNSHLSRKPNLSQCYEEFSGNQSNKNSFKYCTFQ